MQMRTRRQILWEGAASLVVVIAAFAGCCGFLGYLNHEYDGFERWEGEQAWTKLMPSGATMEGYPAVADTFMIEGGTFSGTILYWAITCRTNEECFALIAWNVKESEFKAWEPPRFRVDSDGPAFYGPTRYNKYWDLDRIVEGKIYEECTGRGRAEFYAIDTQRHRVYHSYQSGGFPKHPNGTGSECED